MYIFRTNSQTSEPTHSTTNSLNDMKKKTSITSITTKSSPNSQPSSSSVGTEKNEPQIKILCHIEATSAINDDIKVETTDNNLSPKIAPKIIPMRENLIRQAKQKKLPTTEETPKIIAEIKSESFSKDDFPAEPERHLLSPQEPFVIPDRRKKILRSPRLTNLKNNLEITQSKMRTILADNDQLLLKSNIATKREEGEKVQTTPTHFKVEPPTGDSATIATFKSSPQKSELASRLSVSQENIAKTAEKDYHSCDEVLSVDRSLSPTSAMIKQKLQAALEESRKTKPSIFIIQSLESNKEKLCRTKSVSSIETKCTPTTTTTPVPETLAPITSSKLSTKLSEFTSRIAKTVKKENNSKRRLKMRKTKMFSLRSTPKRELRTRKIILLKSNKKRTTAIGKKTKKEAKSIVQFPRKSSPTKPALNTSAAKSKEVLNKVNIEVQPPPLHQIKSYRNAQTETNDLDMYNKQSRNRLMAKATALIQRSRRRMSLCRAGGSGGKDLRSKLLQKNTINTAPNAKVLPNLQPKIRLVRAKIEESLKDEGKACSSTASTMPSPSTQQPAVVSMTTTTANRTDLVLKEDREALNINITNLASSSCILQDNENVVVSSTTNSYDERPIHGGNAPRMPSSPITLRSVHSSASCVVASTPVETKDNWTQSDNQHFATAGFGIQYLNDLPSAVQVMRNPIKREYGLVEYIYYEVDILIVVQERLISFWKSSRLLNALTAAPTKIHTQQQTKQNNIITTKPPSTPPPPMQDSNNSWFGLPSSSSSPPTAQQSKGEWILLGELKRLTYGGCFFRTFHRHYLSYNLFFCLCYLDFEVTTAYANRICLHNSTPIYVEMRAHPLPNNNRECNLLSMYINIYYYHDEDMIAKTNSIQLDTIQR